MKVKKRKLLVSALIFATMILIGFVIASRIKSYMFQQYRKYDSALRVDTQEDLIKAIKSGDGYVFAYGELQTIDPVSYPEIAGKYSYLKKKEQKYQSHLITVLESYTDSNGNIQHRTKIKEDWSWDTVRTEEKTATRISFLNIEFEYGKIRFPSSHHIATVKKGYRRREVYYGTEASYKGTIFSSLEGNAIDNKTSFYKDKTIDETIKHLEAGYEIIIFWIVWILVTSIITIVFYCVRNKWLD